MWTVLQKGANDAHVAPSPMSITQKVDGQSELGGGGGEGLAVRKHKGALQHSQH